MPWDLASLHEGTTNMILIMLAEKNKTTNIIPGLGQSQEISRPLRYVYFKIIPIIIKCFDQVAIKF